MFWNKKKPKAEKPKKGAEKVITRNGAWIYAPGTIKEIGGRKYIVGPAGNFLRMDKLNKQVAEYLKNRR